MIILHILCKALWNIIVYEISYTNKLALPKYIEIKKLNYALFLRIILGWSSLSKCAIHAICCCIFHIVIYIAENKISQWQIFLHFFLISCSHILFAFIIRVPCLSVKDSLVHENMTLEHKTSPK